MTLFEHSPPRPSVVITDFDYGERDTAEETFITDLSPRVKATPV